jgi:hypothetical protein
LKKNAIQTDRLPEKMAFQMLLWTKLSKDMQKVVKTNCVKELKTQNDPKDEDKFIRITSLCDRRLTAPNISNSAQLNQCCDKICPHQLYIEDPLKLL